VITASEIAWGEYKPPKGPAFEGPWFRGRARIAEPPSPGPLEKLLAVVMATESGGGHPDAINMYDVCMLTLGLIQHCEASGQQAAQLLAAIRSTTGPAPFEALDEHMARRGMRLGMAGNRAAFLDSAGAAILTPQQRALAFFGGASGHKGSWLPAQKQEAKSWAAVFASTLGDERTFAAHVRHASSKLLTYVLPPTRSVVFAGGVIEGAGWRGALQALVVSFAANIPTVADHHWRAYLAEQGGRIVDSQAFVVGAAAALTYRPQIAIYPRRLKDIIPAIKRLYGVDLSPALLTPSAPSLGPIEAELVHPYGVQAALMALGYDLGPRGIDSRIGPKTRAAIGAFQESRGLEVTEEVDPRTRAELARAVEAALAALQTT
jgi:hypothetical protein